VSCGQDKYPTKGVELVIPWGPGGLSDVSGRIFAHELSKLLNVTFTPVNKPGGSGFVGANYVAHHAKIDGYSLLANTQGSMIMAALTLPDPPFDVLRDFVPICIFTFSPSILFVRKDSPLKTLEDLVAEAKKNPGKLKYATAGVGITEHLNVIQLENGAKIRVTNIPYKSGGEVVTSTMGGHSDFGSIGLVAVGNQVAAGEVRGLAFSNKKRVPVLPDVPTLLEKFPSEFFFINWAGLFAPKGVAPSVVDVLVRASEKVMKSQEFITRIEKTGASVEYLSPEDTRKLIENEKKVAEKIIKDKGLSQK